MSLLRLLAVICLLGLTMDVFAYGYGSSRRRATRRTSPYSQNYGARVPYEQKNTRRQILEKARNDKRSMEELKTQRASDIYKRQFMEEEAEAQTRRLTGQNEESGPSEREQYEQATRERLGMELTDDEVQYMRKQADRYQSGNSDGQYHFEL